MPRPERWLGPAALFALVYTALIVPWPGVNAPYGRAFRALVGAAYSRDDARLLVYLRAAEHPPRAEIDTEIVVATKPANASGDLPARLLGLDTRSVGWVPLALLVALIVATPVPWRRRLVALALGLILINTYVLFVVGVYLWNETAGATTWTWLPYAPALGDALEETFVTQLGPSFVVPVLIWAAVTFRRPDWLRLFGRAKPADADPPR